MQMHQILFFGGHFMNSGRLTILERLKVRSQCGRVSAELNLYPRQAHKLIEEGFSIEKIAPVYGRQGQHRYRISWRNSAPDTVAYNLLMTAASCNEQLRAELEHESAEPVKPPYSF